jgi:hypothetical protein
VNALVRLGKYTSTEGGFLRASTGGLGVPAAALGAWGFAGYGGVASVLIIPLAFIGAYVWGFIMWRLMFRDLYARKLALNEQAGSAGQSQRAPGSAPGSGLKD